MFREIIAKFPILMVLFKMELRSFIMCFQIHLTQSKKYYFSQLSQLL